ncbi:MAG: hypothetical protein JXM70_27840 [Pirellulales bacterium]|nr:hypothetical protein [Pirellulales bacterium]
MYERERNIDESEARELAAIEAELAAFQPEPGRLDRDRTMYLAGRASANPETAPCPSKTSTRLWATAFAAMTATAGCLLLAVVVQHSSIVALRADVQKTTVESTSQQTPAQQQQPEKQPKKQPESDVPDREKPPRQALVGDSGRMEFEPGRFDFSEKRLLALADSGTLSARSLMMLDEPQVETSAKTATSNDWPQQTYEPRSQPLPYYKLLRQIQAAGI